MFRQFKYTWFALIGAVLLLAGCNLERAVDLDLPDYQPEPVLELYLQPGSAQVALLSLSSGFLDPIQLNFLRDAKITVRHNNRVDTLFQTVFPLPPELPGGGNLSPVVGDSLYFYVNPNPVPDDYDNPFFLEANLGDSIFITAETIIPRPIPIDTVEFVPDADSMYYVRTIFNEPGGEVNFYRVTIHKSSLANLPEQDFSFDDEVFDGQQVSLGTAYNFEKGDTVIVSLYHITADYNRFLETSDAAFNANLSPFALPALIASNLSEGIGIFTGFSLDRKTLIVE